MSVLPRSGFNTSRAPVAVPVRTTARPLGRCRPPAAPPRQHPAPAPRIPAPRRRTDAMPPPGASRPSCPAAPPDVPDVRPLRGGE